MQEWRQPRKVIDFRLSPVDAASCGLPASVPRTEMSTKKSRPTPPPPDPHPSGPPPQGGPPANRQVCVYRVGRLLNEIAWHAQQAWLLVDSQHADRVEQLLDDLSLEARSALPEPARKGVEADIVRHRDWWGRGFGHPDHHRQDLLAVNERIDETLASPDVGIARARAEVLRHSFPVGFHASLREVVEGHLVEDEIPLLNLGEVVDQGIRPADVSAWLYDPGIEPEELPITSPGQREPRWYVANLGREPGELPPDRRWPARIRQLWREARLAGELPADVLPDANNLDREAIPRCVEAVDAAIRHALSPLAFVRAPAPDAPPRVVIEWESHTVFVDGHVLARVDSLPALRIFERIVLDQGELVTARELKQLPGCKGRIDRIIRNGLPKDVKDLICSKVGSGGGYWLNLPQLGP
jgi:hypothetical protein